MRILYITGAIVLFDQITKLLVKGFSLPVLDLYHPGLPLGSSQAILGDFLRLTFIENPGMAFGIDVGGKLFLTIFSLVASGAIFIYLYKIREEALVIRLSLAMILGGAIGNLIDRLFYGVIFGEGPLFYGKVVDFVDVDFFNIELLGFHISRWPVFNVADASVSIGVLILLVFHRRFAREEGPAVSLAPEGSSSPRLMSSKDGMKVGGTIDPTPHTPPQAKS
ncbi:MAG: signal peptidase II [Ignavibacteriales bacterium]|nr:signal peptidase II [Ignavibacteriales bacterium]